MLIIQQLLPFSNYLEDYLQKLWTKYSKKWPVFFYLVDKFLSNKDF